MNDPGQAREKGINMMLKARALLLTPLVLVVVGSALSAPASAEPGPFWHHKPIGSGSDEGKIEQAAKEEVAGESTEIKLVSKAGGTEVEIVCNLKTEETIWNITNLGHSQVKSATFSECKLVKPAITGCTLSVTALGLPWQDYLMWKYLGNKKELANVNQQAAQPTGAGQMGHIIRVPNGVGLTKEGGFTSEAEILEVNFGAKCGVLTSLKMKAEGAFSGEFETAPETFSQSIKIKYSPNGQLQHYWNGTQFVPIK